MAISYKLAWLYYHNFVLVILTVYSVITENVMKVKSFVLLFWYLSILFFWLVSNHAFQIHMTQVYWLLRDSLVFSLYFSIYRLSLRNFPNPEENFAQYVSCFLHIVSILYIDLGICQEQLYLWLDPPINIPHTDFSTSLGQILGNELLLIKYTAVSSLSPNFHLNWAVLL